MWSMTKHDIANAIPDSPGGAGDFNLVKIDPFNRLEFDAIKEGQDLAKLNIEAPTTS